jgi:hypothetical protein
VQAAPVAPAAGSRAPRARPSVPLSHRSTPVPPRFASRARACLALLLIAAPALAQSPAPALGTLLREDFEGGAFPPAGWARFDGAGQPSTSWGLFDDDLNGNVYASAPGYDAPGSGPADDYLATPPLTPTATDHVLTFDAGQSSSALYGSELAVLITTGSQADPAGYVEVAAFAEEALGVAPCCMFRLRVDLSAYVGTPIHVAFRHRQDNGDELFLDDVAVGPAVPARYGRSAFAYPVYGAIYRDAEDYPAGVVNVVVDGTDGTAALEGLTFTTEGSTDPAHDLARARVLYTGRFPYDRNAPGGVPYGEDVLAPSGELSFAGDLALAPGNNYFALTYTLAAEAVGGHAVDGTFTSVAMGGSAHTPDPTSLGGALYVPFLLTHDSLAQATPLAGPGAVVTTNIGAGADRDEARASCAWADGGNSVWWSFTPPAAGTVTIDLEGSDFNTILSLHTGAAHPLTEVACNDDVGIPFYSRLEDVPVEGGTTYYVRVVGFVGFLGTDAGWIALDYAFTPATAAEPVPAEAYRLGAVAPNPLAGRASLGLEVGRTQRVRVEVLDALGRRVATVHDGVLTSGTAHALALDAARLPAGAYVVRATGETFTATRPLTVAR